MSDLEVLAKHWDKYSWKQRKLVMLLMKGETLESIAEQLGMTLEKAEKLHQQAIDIAAGKPSNNKKIGPPKLQTPDERKAVYRANSNEAARARFQERKAAGLCIRCGEPAVPGNLQCEKHRKHANKKHYDREKRRVAEGLCGKCGKQPICKERSQNLCEACLDKMGEYRKHKAAAATQPKPKLKTGDYGSDERRAYWREYAKERRQKKVAAGICVQCSKPVEPGKKTCSFHSWASKQRSR